MSDLVLNHPPENARELVVEAFENTKGISKISSSSHQIVGKTGISFPRVLWSYGETIYVDISESQEADRTPISVRGEKTVPINIGANPDKFKRRFFQELEEIR